MADILNVENLSKSFGKLDILNGLAFSLEEGKSAAVLGPSGAGKSTFLHIVGLMERPTGGTVQIAGRSVSELSDEELARQRLDGIGFLFQFHHLLPDFTVLENVLIPGRLAGDDLDSSEREARGLLERLGLSERLEHKPHQLSGGEQQRAGLARALVRHPKLLLCDEPTGNLDPHTAASVAELIWSEVKRNGVSTIIVTHNQTLADEADAAYRLEDGKFVTPKKKEKRDVSK